MVMLSTLLSLPTSLDRFARRSPLPLLVGLIVSFVSLDAEVSHDSEDILYLTEEYPPFNYSDGGRLRGIAVDVLDSLLGKMNQSLIRENIRVYPWARGYHLAQTQPGTVLFSTTRTPEREPLFKWVGPIATNRVVLTARKDRLISVRSPDDLKGLTLGVIRDDIAEQLLRQAGVDPKQLDIVGEADANVKKLNKGRIDAWAYGEPVARWFIKKNGYDPTEYETVYVLREIDLYYAFHKTTPDQLIGKFQKTLDALKKKGQTTASVCDRILELYLGPR